MPADSVAPMNPSPVASGAWLPPTGAQLVVEVVSPTSVLRELAELVLDTSCGQYRYATHYTTEAFETRRPWPVRIDLPGLTARRARLMRRD